MAESSTTLFSMLGLTPCAGQVEETRLLKHILGPYHRN